MVFKKFRSFSLAFVGNSVDINLFKKENKKVLSISLFPLIQVPKLEEDHGTRLGFPQGNFSILHSHPEPHIPEQPGTPGYKPGRSTSTCLFVCLFIFNR